MAIEDLAEGNHKSLFKVPKNDNENCNMINMHLSISDFKDFATSYSCFESFKTVWSERRKELELNTIEQYPTSQAIDSPPRLSSMFSMFRYPICISNLVSECLRHGLEWLRGLASTMYTGTFRRRLFFAFFCIAFVLVLNCGLLLFLCFLRTTI